MALRGCAVARLRGTSRLRYIPRNFATSQLRKGVGCVRRPCDYATFGDFGNENVMMVAKGRIVAVTQLRGYEVTKLRSYEVTRFITEMSSAAQPRNRVLRCMDVCEKRVGRNYYE